MTAPPGHRLPRSTAVPLPGGCSGSATVRITSRFQHWASATFSARVRPVTADVVGVQQVAEFGHHGRDAAGVAEVLHQVLARRHQVRPAWVPAGPARRSRPARSGTPSRPAIASRWMTALVEPPIAALTRMAFSNACPGHDLRRPQILLRPSPRSAGPACCAVSSRRESSAGPGGRSGQLHAERLGQAGHRRRGAHGHAVPAGPGHAALGDRRTRPGVIRPAASLRLELPHVRARADVAAAELAVEHRPAGDHDRGQVDARRAHQQCRGGLVAAGQQDDAVERVGAQQSPRRPWPSGCGTASRWAASASRPATWSGTRAGSRPPARRRA